MGDGKKLTAAEKKALKEKVRKLLGADTNEIKALKEKASKLYTEEKNLQQADTNMFGGGGYMEKKSYKGGGMMPKYKKGGKLGKKKGLDFNKDGKITKADFILMAKAKMKGKK